MDRTAARAASRALAVLAVLLGLLAMHGLASTHHASAATTATVAEHGATQHQPASDAPEHHQHAPAPTVVQQAAALAAPAGPLCDDACPDLAVLCVAVLTGAALLALLLARRSRTPMLLAPARPHGATRAPPMRHGRPPDPVKELCVSRT